MNLKNSAGFEDDGDGDDNDWWCQQGWEAEAQSWVSGEFTRGGEPGIQGSGWIFGDKNPVYKDQDGFLDFFGEYISINFFGIP